MNYRRLGKSGLQVSELSFGSWVTFGHQINDSISEDLMKLAYDSGINFFDNAEAYSSGGSEVVMGNILKSMNWERSSYVVSTKVFWGGKRPNQKGLSRKHIFEGCHASLKRFQLDYLDLFFCHRPDSQTPIEETVRAMTDLVRQGKILYWGTSEWSAQEIMEAYSVAYQYHLEPPTMEQPQYNLFYRERVENEYQRLYEDTGLGTTIWSPLASGLLTGKYNSGKIPKDSRLALENMSWLKDGILGTEAKDKIEKINKLQQIANEIDISLPCLAIAWCLKNPNVSTVILGASKMTQLQENLKALEALEKLDSTTMEAIENVVQNKPKRINW